MKRGMYETHLKEAECALGGLILSCTFLKIHAENILHGEQKHNHENRRTDPSCRQLAVVPKTSGVGDLSTPKGLKT